METSHAKLTWEGNREFIPPFTTHIRMCFRLHYDIIIVIKAPKHPITEVETGLRLPQRILLAGAS